MGNSGARPKLVDASLATLLVSALLGVYFFDRSSESIAARETGGGFMSPRVETREPKLAEATTAGEKIELASSSELLATKDDPAPSSIFAGAPPEPITESRRERPAKIVGPPEPRRPEISASPQPPPREVTAETPRPPKQEQVEFFKTRVEATSVAFVVDCSSSMTGASFDAARAELARSIVNLQPTQSFYIIFFNEKAIPMGHANPKAPMMRATSAAKEQVCTLLNRAVAFGSTNPEPAIWVAGSLKPDVIYLLTDGGFRPLRNETFAALAHDKIVVHTLGFGADADVGKLQEIAERTGGTFRSVGVADAASTLYLASEAELLAALRSPDAKQRATAVEVIVAREMRCIGDMVDLLADSDVPLRQTVHQALVKLAGGTDFGPADDDDDRATSQALARWYLWMKWRTAKTQVATKLASVDANEVWVAVALARQWDLDLPKELIGVLRHPEVHIRWEARAALVQLAGGLDFGPDPDADAEHVAQAAARWNAWQEMRRDSKQIVAKLASTDANECCVALILARHRSLDVPDELIGLLGHASSDIRREAHAALVVLLPDVDFGPKADADARQIADAVTKWKQWRVEQARQLAAAQVEKQEKRAAAKLKLAQQLLDKGHQDQARARFAEIVKEFPNSKAADEARKLLAP